MLKNYNYLLWRQQMRSETDENAGSGFKSNKKDNTTMRKWLLMSFLFMFSFSFGQTYTIGSGTAATSSAPINGLYVFSYSQILYTSSEITAAGFTGSAGTIEKIRFYVTTPPAVASKSNNWTVYLGNTSLTTLPAGSANYVPASAMTQSFSGTVTFPAAGNWMEITLATPFIYTGGNLIVAVDENSPDYSSATFRGTAAPGMTRVLYSDSSNPDPALLPGTYSGTSSTSANRPNIQLVFPSSTPPNCATGHTPADLVTNVAKNPTLSWTSGGGGATSYDVYFGANTNPGLIGNQPGTTYAPALLAANTTYYWKVVPKNNIGAATGCVERSFTTGTGVNYCASAPTSLDGSGITNVKLGATTFPVAAVSYYSYTPAIDFAAGITNKTLITFATGYTYDTNIWIDLNDNGVFEATELLFQGASLAANPTTLDASFLLSASAPLGVHKMRIATADSGQSTPNPCYNGGYGVTIDANINVTATPTCLAPTDLLATSINYQSATLGWTAPTSGTTPVGYEYEIRTSGAAGSGAAGLITSGTVTSNTVNLTGLTGATTYTYYIRTDCSANDFSAWESGTFTTTGCNLPTAVTATNVMASTAAISWTAPATGSPAGYEYEVRTSGAAGSGATGLALTGTTTSPTVNADLSGLLPSTAYSVYVRSNCYAGFNSIWTSARTFSTTQIPAALPYAQDFTGTNGFSFVNGTQVNKWVNGTAAGNPGNSIYISNDSGVSHAYTITTTSTTQAYRDITIPAGTTIASLSFDWLANGESTNDYLRVWLVPTTYAPTAGTQITASSARIQVGGFFNGQTTWQTYNNAALDLSSFANSTMRLVFEWRNNSSGGSQTPAAVDNISLAIPSCLPPTNLLATNISTNSVNVSWTAPSSTPIGYEYAVTTSATPPASGTAVTGTSATGSVNSSTTYYLHVRSQCSTTEFSSWATSASFTTPCTAEMTPTVVQNFDTFSGSAPSPVCWSEATGALTASSTLTGTTSSWLQKTNGFANASASNKGASINLYSTNNNWLISQPIDLGTTAGLKKLNFDYAVTGYNNTTAVTTLGTHQVRVVVSTDGGSTWSDANVIKTYTGAASYSNTGATEQISLNYSGVVKIGFLATTSSTTPDIDFHIDNVFVDNSFAIVWDGSAWSNTTGPSATDDAIIDGDYNIATAFTAQSVTVNSGKTLTINSSVTSGNLINNGAVVVANDASFIQTNAAVNSGAGTFTVYRNSVTTGGKYAFWSSPVAAQSMYGIFPAAPLNVMTYNTVTNFYDMVASPATATAGVGYSIKVPTTAPAASFVGAPNNGAINVALSLAGTGTDKYNLVGNPYPSNLDLTSFLTTNAANIGSTLWFWDNTVNPVTTQTGTTAVNTGFATYNAAGSGTWVQAPNSSKVPTGNTVKVGQAFIVEATTATLTFDNTQRNVAPGENFNKSASSSASEGKYWLTLKSSYNAQVTQAITYQNAASNNFDRFDSKAIELGSDAFYSYAGSEKVIIQGKSSFDVSDVVSLGNKHFAGGNFIIEISKKEGLFENGQAIFLKDKLLGTVTNLQSGAYSFTSTAGEFADRFEIVYVQSVLGTQNAIAKDGVKVYRSGEDFIVESPTKIESIQVYDASGKLVKSIKSNGNKELVSNLMRGVYILTIKNATETISKKVIK